MNNTPQLSFWRNKLVPSLLGGLIGVCISQLFAYFLLYKNFELTANKERLITLRQEIKVLREVKSEFDSNTKFLIGGESLLFQFTSEEKHIDLQMIQDPAVRDFANIFLQSSNTYYQITSVKVPKRSLAAGSWIRSPYSYDEIQYDLANDLSDFYDKVYEINGAIDNIRSTFLSSGRNVTHTQLDELKEWQQTINEDVKFIAKDKIVDLNSRVGQELRRLEQLRTKIGG